MPMCEPTTVTLDAPVAGRFTATSELGDAAAIDMADVTLPTRAKTVDITLTVRTLPADGLAITDESATQTVATLVLPPMRCTADHRSAPAFVPTTVTVVAPVIAALVATSALDSDDAYVKVADVLANNSCTVDATSLDAPTPLDGLTTTLVSDRHSVDITIDMPMRMSKLRAW